MTLSRTLMATAALLMAVATGLGAWASHGLGASLDASALGAFETGVQYQFVHGLGVFALAVYCERHRRAKLTALAGLVLLTGVVLFSGGVYASSLGGPPWIARLAPVGGIGLIVGWIGVALAVGIERPASERD